MQKLSKDKFLCPECGFDKIRFRFKVSYKDDHVYSGVTEEIQCSGCYMDIPANICIINENTNVEDNQLIWNSLYRPEHIKNAAKCSKCNLFYWQIENKLANLKINTQDIFYQSYDINAEGGKMICRLCDPNSFKK